MNMRGRRSAAHQLVAPHLAVAFSSVAIGLLGAFAPAQAQSVCPQEVTVSPTIPRDVCGGVFKNDSPQNAAIFAWQAFVALNWPALPGTRETPDSTKIFGANLSPVVWETMRAKVEVYPGNGNNTIGPHGATINQQPPYGATNPPLFGYDDPPDYVYSPAGVGTPDGRVAACTGQAPPPQPAWIPLDETTQIGFNQTFAGILPATDPTGNNSAPRLIRYMVKMNRALYTYIVDNEFWYQGPPLNTAMSHFQAALATGQTQDPVRPFVEFPPGYNSVLQ
jgi:hypothetical protein